MRIILQVAIGVLIAFFIIHRLGWLRQSTAKIEDPDSDDESDEAVERSVQDRLAWSISDLRGRFMDVLSKRLDFLADMTENDPDRAQVAEREIANYTTECDALYDVMLKELEGVARARVGNRIELQSVRENILLSNEAEIRSGIERLKAEGIAMVRQRLPAISA